MEMSVATSDGGRVQLSTTGVKQGDVRAQRLNKDLQGLTLRFGGPTKSSFKVREKHESP